MTSTVLTATPPTTTSASARPVTTTARDLALALRVVLPFASDDETHLPPLRSICLQAAGATLTATATDRYVVGHMRVKATGDWAGRPAVLVQDHARIVLALLDGVADATLVELSLAYGGKAVRVTADGVVLLLPNQAGRGISSGDQHTRNGWVSYEELFAKVAAKPVTLTEPIGINPMVMAPFVAALELLSGGFDPIAARWRFVGPTDPIQVEIGSRFVGLIMPARITNHAGQQWPVPVGVTPGVQPCA